MVSDIPQKLKTLNSSLVGQRSLLPKPAKGPTNRIKSHIQRQLLLRLGLGGAIISLVLSLGVYVNERHQISRQVIERTRQGASRFNTQIESLLNAPEIADRHKLQEKLEILFIAAKRLQETGHFVFIGIYKLNGEKMAAVSDPAHPYGAQVKQSMDRFARPLSTVNRSDANVRYIDGAPHIHLTVPLINSSGLTAARAEAVYAISSETVAEIESRILKTVLTVIAIVMGTTALLYPLIALLIHRLSRLATSLLDANLETLRVLGSAVAKRDSETDVHNYRVTIYAVRLAEALKLDAKSIRGLIKGAFLHDVGKIGVSDSILLKPGRLSEVEFDNMKRHVQHGVDIIKSSDWLYDAAEVVGYHHEKYGGNGYPFGLQGGQIPQNARIFAIADVFDALTSRRPYKEPYSLEKTLQILSDMRGHHLDPDLLDAFVPIASGLYRDLANGNEKAPARELESIIGRYFKRNVSELVRSSHAVSRLGKHAKVNSAR